MDGNTVCGQSAYSCGDLCSHKLLMKDEVMQEDRVKQERSTHCRKSAPTLPIGNCDAFKCATLALRQTLRHPVHGLLVSFAAGNACNSSTRMSTGGRRTANKNAAHGHKQHNQKGHKVGPVSVQHKPEQNAFSNSWDLGGAGQKSAAAGGNGLVVSMHKSWPDLSSQVSRSLA